MDYFINLTYIYTFTLFTFLMYLLYLRVYHLGTLTDIKVKATINFNFYVFMFYLSLFVLSLSLSIFVYLIDLGGTALARMIVETMPDDYSLSYDDSKIGGVNRDSEVTSQRDVTPTSPSEPKKPKGGFVAATWQSICDSGSNFSLKITKDVINKASENNLVCRNDAAVKNTMGELISNNAVPAKTINFEKTESVWGYGVEKGKDGKITIYGIGDMPTAKLSYEERMLSANVEPVYSRSENMGINLLLSTNKLGEPLAFPLQPEPAALVAEGMGYKANQLSDLQRTITRASLRALADDTNYSPPITPTHPRNTHNPFQ